MNKKTTLRDISAELGLSTAAVSKALRGLNGISEETRKAVIAVARKRNYKGIANASMETGAPAGKVLLLVDQRYMTEPHTVSAYFFMDQACKETNFQLSLTPVPPDNIEDTIREALSDADVVAGVLFGRFPERLAAPFKAMKKPLFLYDNFFPYENVDSVKVDDYAGAFLAVEHFVRNGHARIGFIGDRTLSPAFNDRYRGFIDAMQYWGLEICEDYVYDLKFVNERGEIEFHLLRDHVDTGKLPTAFFCSNDPIAIILNNYLKENGIAIPEQVSVIGFDNLETCQWQSPALTSLHYPRETIAREMVGLIRWREEHPEAPAKRVMIRPNLIARQSVMRLDPAESGGGDSQ